MPGVPPLSFKTSYATPLFQQYLLILAKNSITYWRCVSGYNVCVTPLTAAACLGDSQEKCDECAGVSPLYKP